MAQLSGSSIAETFHMLRQQIPASVRLIAVSKTVPPEKMREAYEAGARDFGESRVQEAIPKQEALQDLTDITWHFIGRLQTNKSRKVIEHFQWIHSVDSLKLAQRLNDLAQELQCSPSVCLQVQLMPDPTKQGWSEPDLWRDLIPLSQLEFLQIRGLMIIPPRHISHNELQKLFHKTQNLLVHLRDSSSSDLPLSELSMGMSGDYLIAIENGSTMVRLGTILFGKR